MKTNIKAMPKLRLEKLQNAEFYILVSRVIDFLSDNIVEKYKLGEYLAPLKKGRDEFREIYLTNKKSSLIPEIKHKEHERDNSFIVFKQSIDLQLRSRSASKLEAAKKLKAMIAAYKDANSEDTLTSIAMIEGFAWEAQEDEYAGSLATLGLTTMVKTIEDENKALDILYRKHNDEKLSKKQSGNLKKLRQEVSPIYRQLLIMVSTVYGYAVIMKDEEGIKELEEIVDRISAETNDLEAKMHRRDIFNKKKKEEKEKKKEEQEKPKPTTPPTITPPPPKPEEPEQGKPKPEGEGDPKPEKPAEEGSGESGGGGSSSEGVTL